MTEGVGFVALKMNSYELCSGSEVYSIAIPSVALCYGRFAYV